jgi:hypothetical protein
MILAHIAGLPVEETLLGFAPVGLVGAGVALLSVRQRAAELRERMRRLGRRP